MILRGAIFTAERRHLGAQSVCSLAASSMTAPAQDALPHLMSAGVEEDASN